MRRRYWILLAIAALGFWIGSISKLTPEEHQQRKRARMRPGSFLVETAYVAELPSGVPSDPFAFVREAQAKRNAWATEVARVAQATPTVTRDAR